MGRFITGLCFLIIIAIPLLVAGGIFRRRGERWKAKAEAGDTKNYGRGYDTASAAELAEDDFSLARLLRWGGVGVALFGALLLVWSTVRVVSANSVGIPTQFGSIGEPLPAGFHFTAPWTTVHTFSTRMQETSMLRAADEGDKAKDDSVEVRGSDGYLMNVDVTVRYFIEGDNAAKLFKLVGSEDGIRERLVRPEVRESVRVQFAKFTSEEGYTSKRDAIRTDISEDLTTRLARYGLRLDSVAIRNVEPDDTLGKAISDRAAAREKALQATIEQGRLTTEAETRRQVAETDAKAKVIAAQGEADANDIITRSITPDLLTLKQIEALRDANTVYIPAGANIIVSPAGASTP